MNVSFIFVKVEFYLDVCPKGSCENCTVKRTVPNQELYYRFSMLCNKTYLTRSVCIKVQPRLIFAILIIYFFIFFSVTIFSLLHLSSITLFLCSYYIFLNYREIFNLFQVIHVYCIQCPICFVVYMPVKSQN